MAAVFLTMPIIVKLNSMNNNSNNTRERYTRKITASRLRRFLADMAEDITAGVDRIPVTARGGCIAIHLEGATINITINREKGGES